MADRERKKIKLVSRGRSAGTLTTPPRSTLGDKLAEAADQRQSYGKKKKDLTTELANAIIAWEEGTHPDSPVVAASNRQYHKGEDRKAREDDRKKKKAKK
jgi:hypothetical protein